jgi:hypothetical protein
VDFHQHVLLEAASGDLKPSGLGYRYEAIE